MPSSEPPHLKRHGFLRRRRRGILIAFIPAVMLWTGTIVADMSGWHHLHENVVRPIGFGLMIVYLLLMGLLLYSELRLRHRSRDAAPGLCPACGYDLRASKDCCPECGTPITTAATDGGNG
jgi:hypothetical protein